MVELLLVGYFVGGEVIPTVYKVIPILAPEAIQENMLYVLIYNFQDPLTWPSSALGVKAFF